MLPRIFDLFTQVDGVAEPVARRAGDRSGPGPHAGGDARRAGDGGQRRARQGERVRDQIAGPSGAGGAGHDDDAGARGNWRARPLRVLVVEDNVDSADSLSMLLRLYGHEVLVARTGPAALEMAAEFRPALVLLDIGLPGMDGYEVARRLRANPDLDRHDAVRLTGYTPSEADRLAPAAPGFDHHFVKPVSMDTLNGLLKTLA